MNYKVLAIGILAGLVACEAKTQADDAPAAEHSQIPEVKPSAQTTPTAADGANDPAIWIDPADVANSLILGAGGAGGLEVYTPSGDRIATAGGANISLVDVRSEFALGDDQGDETVGLVVAYDVDASEILGYTVDAKNRTVVPMQSALQSVRAELEGLCLYQSPLSGKSYVFATADGMVEQWELLSGDGAVTLRSVRSIPVGYGAGHCAGHDAGAAIYFSHEIIGVFKLNAEPESETEMETVDVAAPFGSFAGDVKGITTYEHDDGGYLLVSDADESRLQIYDLESLQHVATAAVTGADESEGIVATAAAGGLLVLTDDDNDGKATNYKIVQWADFAAATGLVNGTVSNPGRKVANTAITVSPSAQTDPVQSFGDAADDPAIWVHPEDPELSIIIGSQKKRGINVYDLTGKLIESRADGRINNIDLRYGFDLDGKKVDIITGSNRSTDSISVYIVDQQTRTLIDVADGIIDTGMADPYGQCMYKSVASGKFYVYINDTDGLVRQWELHDNGNGKVGATEVRDFNVGSQTEGCVADDEIGDLYVGEENVGIWKYSAEPDGGDARTLVDGVDENGNLTADVEGLAIYYGKDGGGYLVASNQGADNYALYERAGDNRFIGIFHVVADDATGIDGISETDGLDVNSAYLGPDYPDGIFVAQDGRNISPAERQNYKVVPWHRISEAMQLK